MLNQVPAAFSGAESAIQVRTLSAQDLAWDRHFNVVYQHEARAYNNRVKGFFAAFMRFLVAKLMTGAVDEYVVITTTNADHYYEC